MSDKRLTPERLHEKCAAYQQAAGALPITDLVRLQREAENAAEKVRRRLPRRSIPGIAERDLDAALAAREALGRATRDAELRLAGELHCERCGDDYPVWVAPNPLWNLVLGGPDAKGDPGGMLCPTCFALLAEQRGIKPTAWVLLPEADWLRPILLGQRTGPTEGA